MKSAAKDIFGLAIVTFGLWFPVAFFTTLNLVANFKGVNQ